MKYPRHIGHIELLCIDFRHAPVVEDLVGDVCMARKVSG